jgi:hypothetical protein
LRHGLSAEDGENPGDADNRVLHRFHAPVLIARRHPSATTRSKVKNKPRRSAAPVGLADQQSSGLIIWTDA